MQRIYLLARACQAKADPEQWLADLYLAQTSVYERAVVIMAGGLGLGRYLPIPETADKPKIVALVKIWQAELPPLPVPAQKQAFQKAQKRSKESFEDFRTRVKGEAKERQVVSLARRRAEAELAKVRTPKAMVTDYGAMLPMSDATRKQIAESRDNEGKVYLGARRIRETPSPNPKANAYPIHWSQAV